MLSVMAMAVIFGIGADAAAQTYGFGETAWSWTDVSATGTNLGLGDNDFRVVPLPFELPWFGEPVSQVKVSSNGYVVMGNDDATRFFPDDIPVAGAPNNYIAPLWADLNPAAGGGVYVQTLGVAPARRFVMQWEAVPYNAGVTPNTFQLIIHEGTGYMEVKLKFVAAGRLHTIGLENVDATDFLKIDSSSGGYFEKSWVIQGLGVLRVPDCGTDARYDCYIVPYEFDSVMDEIFLPPDYVADLDYNYEWQDIPAADRWTIGFGAGVNIVEYTAPIPLPFNFDFYGQTILAGVPSLSIGEFGLLSFEDLAAYGDLPEGLPNTLYPDGIVAPAWTQLAVDNNPAGCGQVYFGTVGSAPDRRFVVTYDNVCTRAEAYFGLTGGLYRATFQVVFYEATSEIRFNYALFAQLANAQLLQGYYPPGNANDWGWLLADTTVGLEDRTATRGTNLVGSDSPGLSFANYVDYSLRMTYQSRPDGVGRKLFATPYRVSPVCDDAVSTIDNVAGPNGDAAMFPFQYYDQAPTSTVFASANGLLGFTSTGMDEDNPNPFPTASNPNNILSPAWTDLLPCGGGTVGYTVRGGADSHRLVVQWDGIPQEAKRFDANGNLSFTTWYLANLTRSQAQLNEGSGTIQFNVQQINLVADGTDLAIGLENGTGSTGIGLYFDPWSSPRFYNPMTRKFVRSCRDSGVTLGDPCGAPVGQQGACAVSGVWACVAGQAVCAQDIFPVPEVCDGVDNDCDGIVDNGAQPTWWQDEDGDGYGGDLVSVQACTAPAGFVDNNLDCNDADAAIHPGATEICDYIDNDCDVLIDENAAGVNGGLRETLYADLDGDTFGADPPLTLCRNFVGLPTSDNNLDCNDADANVNPDADEVCDGVDNDCDGGVDNSPSDVGGACLAAALGVCANGTLACIDGNPLCRPRLPTPETCDGDDNDCDGTTDEVNDAPMAFQSPTIGLYYTFDQRSDNSVDDLAGSADDGRAIGATRVAGRYQGGMHLGGSNYVQVTDGIDREADLAGTTEFTAMAWVKQTSRVEGNQKFLFRDGQIDLHFHDGEMHVKLETTSGNSSFWAETRIALNQWALVALVNTGTEIKFYINGINVRTHAVALAPLRASGNPLRIGDDEKSFEGDVDEVILWKNALSDAEILDIFVAPGIFSAMAPGGNVRCDTNAAGVCGDGFTVCSAADGYVMICEGRVPLPQELCNGIDDDCDTSTDEPNQPSENGFGAQGGGSCDTGLVGVCRGGHYHCQGASGLVCQSDTPPSEELCDSRDNDCDGTTDEAANAAQQGYGAEGGAACQTPGLGICKAGHIVCQGGSLRCKADREPGPEICDGVDNDCDGLIDEDDSGNQLSQACGCFGGGTQVCVAGEWGRCSARFPSNEICDGVDNDCDGLIDEGIVRRCTTQCGDGLQACAAGEWGSCSAPEPRLELCDGIDNDCNGLIDEDLFCGCRVYPASTPADGAPLWRLDPVAFITDPTFNRFTGTPLVAPLYETDGNFAIVDTNDRAYVLAMTAREDDPDRGILRTVDGLNGTVRRTISHEVAGRSTAAMAELSGGVRADIVAYGHPNENGGVFLFQSNGDITWQNTEVSNDGRAPRGALAVGEIDAGGLAEIVGCHFALRADGTTLFNHSDEPHTPYCSPILVDLDDDGDQEVVMGGVAYQGDGSEIWRSPALITANGGFADALSAAGDLDGDGTPEIVASANDIFVLDHTTGAVKARAGLPGGGRGGAPHLADINNDGLIEIVVAGAQRLVVYQYIDTGVTQTLNTLWAAPIQDTLSGVATATSIDLTNDGIDEVLFNDERYLRAYDGVTGAVVWEFKNWGGRGMSTPVVADLNDNGTAELLLVANTIGDFHNTYLDGIPALSFNGLTALTSPTWPQTRELWTQHSYHITDIQENMVPPVVEPHHWADPDLNRFRSNLVTNAALFDAPDLTLSILDVASGTDVGRCSAWTEFTVEVCNIGALPVPAGVEVHVWTDPEAAPGWRQVETLSDALSNLLPDNCTVLTIGVVLPPTAAAGVYDVHLAVDGPDLFAECREDNNEAHRPFLTLEPPTPEKCDGVDNDCDGLSDEADDGSPLQRDCPAQCNTGSDVEQCIAGAWSGCPAPDPQPEICDGIDNDCDGIIDNQNLACDGGQTCQCRVVGGSLDCACIDTLTVPGGCGVGCPLGFICGDDQTCTPYCIDDGACPVGEVCIDHLCAVPPARTRANPDELGVQPNTAEGCSTGENASAQGLGGLLLMVVSALAVTLGLRRR